MLGRLPSLKERPILNSMYLPANTTPEPRSMNLGILVGWVKRTPEAIGILKRIATDIVTDITFTAVESKKTGRPSKTPNQKAEDNANRFAEKNMFRQKLMAIVIDWLMTGDFYLWKGKLSDSQIKEIAMKHYKEYGLEVKSIDTKQFYDEDYNGINSIEIVPSSMVKIKHDDFKINKYIQQSLSGPTKDREFLPEEIIHGKFMEIDGRVYGYSPMEASYTAIRTINAIQDYSYYYFENGAKIDRVWKFMGNPNPTYIEKFKESLRQYTHVKNAHGSLVLTGADKIESEALNEVSEEMEFRQLAIHQVGRLAFAFNMPADILSAILGVDVKGTAMGSDIEDAGYNRNILQAQRYLEDLINSQLFIPEFKVTMQLERTFRQDQIRQVQYRTMAVPFVEFLFKHDYPVTDEFIHDLLQIPRKYLEKGKIEREVETDVPFGPPGKQKPQGASSQTKKLEQGPQQNIQTPTGS